MLAVGKLRIPVLCVARQAPAVSVSRLPSGRVQLPFRCFGAPENASKLELRGRVRVLNRREFISTAYAEERVCVVRKHRSRGLPAIVALLIVTSP